MNINMPGEEPKFFDMDDEIRRLTQDIDAFTQDLFGIDQDYRMKYDHIQVKVDRLQALLGTYKDKQEKLHLQAIQKKQEMRAANAANRTRLQELERQKKNEIENKALGEIIELIKDIAKDLEGWHKAREYQVEDIVQIIQQYMSKSSGVMNANEMSLGKTFETLVALFIIIQLFLKEHGRQPTILWLTKKGIIDTGGTYREVKRWYPELKVFPIKGAANKASIDMVFKIAGKGGCVVLTNYEMIKKMPLKKWDIVITDEVHKLRGGANVGGPTGIWTAYKELEIGFQMQLTGTPVANKIEEIWSYLHLFDPVLFDDVKKFRNNFRAYRTVAGEMKFDIHSENMLKQLLKGRLIRRTAKEVGLQMPPVTYETVWLEHEEQQGKYYQEARDYLWVQLDRLDPNKGVPITSLLAQLTRLRQINVLPVCKFTIKDKDGNIIAEERLDYRGSSKIDEAVEIIQKTNDQVIVFSNFNEPLNELAFRLQVDGIRAEVISSEYAGKMDQFEVGFQNQEIGVLCINMAMGEGMNLHKDPEKWPGGARAVIILDKWWNNARNNQAVARAVRPQGDGTQVINDPVFVYDLKVEHSVDLLLQALCDEKSAELDLLTESKELRPASEWKRLLRELL